MTTMEGEDTDNHEIFNDIFYYGNGTHDINGTLSFYDHPFSLPVTRAIIIICHSIVFLACIIGNVLVLIVIIRNRRMRTLTNLFLANLAVADLCVGIVCIFPNILKYLFLQWFLGKVMCKMFQFVECMNLTASMLLLEVVAVERYIAINHPLKAKRLFTRKNMYFAQFAVWMISLVYNVPVLIMYDLHQFQRPGNNEYTVSYCYPDEKFQLPNNTLATYDIVTFVIWYVLPLIVMTAIYASMAHTLRKTTLPNYIVPALSSNRHVNASLCLSQTGKVAETLRKSELKAKTMTAKLRENNMTRSEQSLTSATTLESSPLKQPGLPTELELSRIYTQRTTLNKIDQNALQPHHDISKIAHSKLQARVSDRPSLASTISSNSSEDDPLSIHRPNGQLTDLVLPITPKGKTEKTHHLDKLLNTNGGGGSHVTPLTLRVNTHNNTTISKVTTSTRSCRYRQTSQRASRRRVIRLLIVVLAAFAALVLPHHLVLLLTTFHQSLGFGSFAGPLCDLTMFLNSAVNPVLYSLFSQSFRKNLKEAIQCCRRNQSSRKRTPLHYPVRRTHSVVNNRFAV